MTALPTLNTIGWSIDSFELAFDGLRQIADAGTWLTNQPRATRGFDYLPGADFIAEIGEGWCSDRLQEIIEQLEVIRFEDPAHDERRVLLLVTYYSSHGSASEPLAKIIQMALGQSVRPAA